VASLPYICQKKQKINKMETFENNDLQMKPRHQFKTMLVGILIVSFGLLYMLRNMGMINHSTWHMIFSWPMLLVVLGVVNLAERKFSWGVLLLAVGVVFLADRYYDLPYNLFTFFWPIIIIMVGVSLIFSNSLSSLRFKRSKPDVVTEDGDYIDEAAIFGGSERVIYAQNFRGGKVVAIFGGTKLDLTQCQLAPGNNYLEMIAIFGGSTLIVPNDWNVKVESFNAFGGFADKRRNLNIDISKTLVIKGATVFGGGELKSY